MSPLDTAAFWIEYVARHGKSALRPPVLDLAWWQASLLDVYSFIISVIFITLFVVKMIIKKIIAAISPEKSQHSHSKLKKN